MLPRIVLTVGDPAGIGPELCRLALADAGVAQAMRLVVVGPAACRPAELAPHTWVEPAGDACREAGSWEMGRPQEVTGQAALAALRRGAELAKEGGHALVTAPVCKEALHLAGAAVEGQTELLIRWDGAEGRAEMVGISGALRVMLLTRHLPLRQALEEITTERVLDRLRLFDRSLRSLGISAPRLALAGQNPHAGENGVLGWEEGERLLPAVARAREEGIAVEGPRPADSVFLEGSRGLWDGVLALYHDQAFIPLKLLSQGRGLTWIAGLSYLRLSPVHGTAFPIAGRGEADPTNLLHALHTAAGWGR